MTVDEKDKKIIRILLEHSDYTTSKISKKTRIPITTVHNRIRKLKKEGIIKNYTVNLDHKKLGLDLAAIILVTVLYDDKKETDQWKIASQLKGMEEVEESSIVTGTTDIVIKVRAKNIDGLNDFIIHKLRNVHGVDKTQTMIVLKEV